MTVHSKSNDPNQWQSPEYVDSWLADKARQASRQRLREKLVSLLPFEPGAIIRVLDIGAGDGVLGLEVLGAYPKTQLVCHDFSETMLDRARQQLAQFSEAITFVKSDLKDPAWTHAIEGKFDAIVSSIAIHNVAESNQGAPERIREIYGEVFGLVKPGGCFLNYDHITAPGPVVQRIYRKEQFIADQARLKADMDTEKSLQGLEQGVHEQRGGSSREQTGPGGSDDLSILDQLEWLKQAGFDEVDCLWMEPLSVRGPHSVIFGGFRH
ncbi:class I SAM-dependent methyltransferase [Chloroflexota bacterium]